MRICFPILLVLTCLAGLRAQQEITLEDIWYNGAYDAKSIPGFRFQNDGRHYTLKNGARIEQFNLLDGQKTADILDAAAVETDATDWTGQFASYAFSRDEQQILLFANTENLYRYSRQGDYYLYQRNNRSITKLYEGVKQRLADFSPDGSKVAFLAHNDLFYKELNTGKTIRITTDGRPNAIINGTSDWVYEEEFGLTQAYAWSPDGRRIAFLRFDESQVPSFTMEKYTGGAYPELETFKYPKVGETNATVTAWVYDLATGEKTQLQTDGYYLPRIQWTPGGEVCLTVMNRWQNDLSLLLFNPANGRSSTLLRETSPYYLDLEEPIFLADGSGFVWQSEKSGFKHLYLYDMKGREKAKLTKGDFDVTACYGVDEARGVIFYQAAARNPMEREVYSVKLNGKGRKALVSGKGAHSANFSRTFDYFVHTLSGANTPPQYSVCDAQGKTLRTIEDNAELRKKQELCSVLPVTFFEIPVKELEAPDGKTWSGHLNAWMIRPDKPELADQKLPVLMFVYGGPGSQQVLDAWSGGRYWWFQMLAQQGYVVVCVDNRGTGARGEYFKKMTYLNLGKYETIDQIAAAKHLGGLPFVDPARIGIFGWSYGGFMSSLCLLKGNDVFQAGIAVAPVTNFKWYDTIYTERYMRTEEENPEGYAMNAPANLAARLKGNYLLVHGMADDNVHFQHTAEMANRLIAADKQFDTMIYPNRNHGIGDRQARLHLYTRMTKFLNDHLKNTPKTTQP